MKLDLQKIADIIELDKCPVHSSPPVVIVSEGNIQFGTCCRSFHFFIEGRIDDLGHAQLESQLDLKNLFNQDVQG